MVDRTRVFTIPASAPFLPTLIQALQEDRLGLGFSPGSDPLALADLTIYLPTRRACRLLRERYLQIANGEATVLPRLVSLNDVDADEILFSDAASGGELLDLPDALDGLERQTLLAQLVLKWAARIAPADRDQAPLVTGHSGAAMTLAKDLARLMDDMTTRQVDWSRLERLVPEEFDRYWQLTLEFLKLIHEPWHAILAERNRIEPAARRDLLIEAEAARLARHGGPVIAAGSTGSIPATAKLLSTIARLPRGALVLPGLDTELDAATWGTISGDDAEETHGHPQFAMHALLRRIGIAREAVGALGKPASHGRERIVSEALRPAAASDLWHARLRSGDFAVQTDRALQSIVVIESANAEDEALAIAVVLREAMEIPHKTAALVTPDRTLARRVLVALERWDVPVDDSGGDALADTPAGTFARLAATAALEGLPPVTLLALLKHPLCRCDAQSIATLERAVLRGPRPKPGSAGLLHALETFRAEHAKARRGEPSSLHRSDPRLMLADTEIDGAVTLVKQLAAAFEPLEALSSKPVPFSVIAKRHAAVVAALGKISDELHLAFDDIEQSGSIVIEPADYPELFHAAIAERIVRRPEQNVRVRIFGPLEARLQSVDRLVLGGLVEGIWPPEPRADPWLNRPMRRELGLDLPERRIGLSAHDFAQALGAPEVFLSRAARQGGAPTVASRFVQRLAAIAGEERWKSAIERGNEYLALARALDAPRGETGRISRPAPKPPFAARPKQLSVTEIEDLLRDPYTIFARHVLNLRPLDEIDTPPGAADRGTVIHNAIGDFAKAFRQQMPRDPVRALIEIGERHFAPLADYPEAKAFWWPRFKRIAAWFVGFESARRTKSKTIYAEIGGGITIPFGDGEFRLTVRADRIECLADGRYAILDYKTGAPPSSKQVQAGLAPQLTLEAAILRQGGFKEIPKGASVSELLYVRLRGGAEAGEELPIKFKNGTVDEQADRAFAELTKLLKAFSDSNTAYYSLKHPMWKSRYGDYDHLARVQEWSLTGGADEGEGGE